MSKILCESDVAHARYANSLRPEPVFAVQLCDSHEALRSERDKLLADNERLTLAMTRQTAAFEAACRERAVMEVCLRAAEEALREIEDLDHGTVVHGAYAGARGIVRAYFSQGAEKSTEEASGSGNRSESAAQAESPHALRPQAMVSSVVQSPTDAREERIAPRLDYATTEARLDDHGCGDSSRPVYDRVEDIIARAEKAERMAEELEKALREALPYVERHSTSSDLVDRARALIAAKEPEKARPGPGECPLCEEPPIAHPEPQAKCAWCDGVGRVPSVDHPEEYEHYMTKPCPWCTGRGEVKR